MNSNNHRLYESKRVWISKLHTIKQSQNIFFSKFNSFNKIENIETEESFHRILATDIIAEKNLPVSKELQWMDLQ